MVIYPADGAISRLNNRAPKVIGLTPVGITRIFSSVPPVTLTSEKISFLRIQRVQVIQMLHSTILGLQTHYKAAMLGFNTIAFFLEETTQK